MCRNLQFGFQSFYLVQLFVGEYCRAHSVVGIIFHVILIGLVRLKTTFTYFSLFFYIRNLIQIRAVQNIYHSSSSLEYLSRCPENEKNIEDFTSTGVHMRLLLILELKNFDDFQYTVISRHFNYFAQGTLISQET